MFIIKCPYCGERDMIEFSYGGDATETAPQSLDVREAEAWQRAVYERDNPRGWHVEWWRHSHGCRQWIKVRRNTLTHEISGAALPSEELLAEQPLAERPLAERPLAVPGAKAKEDGS